MSNLKLMSANVTLLNEGLQKTAQLNVWRGASTFVQHFTFSDFHNSHNDIPCVMLFQQILIQIQVTPQPLRVKQRLVTSKC